MTRYAGFLGIMLLVLASFTPRDEPQRDRQLEIDTTLVILRVFNYGNVPVTVFVNPVNEDRRRISAIAPLHEGFLALPSREIRWLRTFWVSVEASDGARPYRTGLIERNLTKMTMVVVSVGEPADTVPGPAAVPFRS